MVYSPSPIDCRLLRSGNVCLLGKTERIILCSPLLSERRRTGRRRRCERLRSERNLTGGHATGEVRRKRKSVSSVLRTRPTKRSTTLTCPRRIATAVIRRKASTPHKHASFTVRPGIQSDSADYNCVQTVQTVLTKKGNGELSGQYHTA